MLDYFKDHKSIVDKIVNHLDSGAMQDVLLRIIECEDIGGNYTGTAQGLEMVKWLSEVGLCDMLQEQLFLTERPELQQSAGEVISAIARSHQYPLLNRISEKKFLKTLTDYALSREGELMLIPILKIYINLLMHIPIVQQRDTLKDMQSQTQDNLTISEQQREIYINNAVGTLTEYTSKFVELLSKGDTEAAQDTPYGKLDPPFGSKRLKVVEYLAALVCTGIDSAKLSVQQSSAIEVCLMFFTKYPYNNLLHHLTTQMLLKIIEDKDPVLIQFLFVDYDLLNWILKAPEFVEEGYSFVYHDKTDIQQYAGYHGHLTKLSNYITQMAEQIDLIKKKTESREDWQTFLREKIEVRNSQENTNNWGVGRPRVVKDLNIKGSDVGFISQLESNQELPSITEDLKDLDFSGDLGSNMDQQLFYLPQRDGDTVQSLSKDDQNQYQALEKDGEENDEGNQFDDNSFDDNANWANFDSGFDQNQDQSKEIDIQQYNYNKINNNSQEIKLVKNDESEDEDQEVIQEAEQSQLEKQLGQLDIQDEQQTQHQRQQQDQQQNDIEENQEKVSQVDDSYNDNNYWKDDSYKYVTIPDE